jgi:hypothetical protein
VVGRWRKMRRRKVDSCLIMIYSIMILRKIDSCLIMIHAA